MSIETSLNVLLPGVLLALGAAIYTLRELHTLHARVAELERAAWVADRLRRVA